jgi:hypothetical protein
MRFLPVRGCHPLWPRFPARSGSDACATGLVRVRSPLLAESLLMSFPPANEMFQFAGFASTAYGFSGRYSLRSGFPHSEISGSKIAPISPKLIAGCHVLHRLSVPRHPPNALLSLENKRQFPDAGTSPTPGKVPITHNETTTADPTAGNQKHEIPPPAASTDPAQKASVLSIPNPSGPGGSNNMSQATHRRNAKNLFTFQRSTITKQTNIGVQSAGPN